MMKLYSIQCNRPGFMKFGRPWPVSSLVEVTDDGAKSKDSPADVAMTAKQFAEIKRLAATPNYALAIVDPDEASKAAGAARAEVEAARAEVAELLKARDRERMLLDDERREREQMREELDKLRRELAETEERAKRAQEAAQSAHAQYEETRTALDEIAGKKTRKK